MSYRFKKKFTEKHIDDFINEVYAHLKNKKEEEYIFDFSPTEKIANQNLLLLSSLFKYLVQCDIKFKIKLFQDDINSINRRQVLNIAALWEKWIVYQFIPENKTVPDYFILNHGVGISETLKKLKLKYSVLSQDELFNNYGITPFTVLPKLNEFKDISILRDVINPIYLLNESIEERLTKYKCEHPFVSKTLSAIITKELYENFLDHFEPSIFKTEQNWAFLSLALQTRVLSGDNKIIKRNFEEEELPETKSFFLNKDQNLFINQDFIQFSFLDFGKGIVDSMLDEYTKTNDNGLFVDENEVLKYSFKPTTSRHPIANKYSGIERLIPRGLFDVITIVKRYNGLILIRSNLGKIAYDFSNNKNFKEAYRKFDGRESYFPGTFITIYIPALIESERVFDYSSIKPQTKALRLSNKIGQEYISLFSIIDEVSSENHSKSVLYHKSIEKLKRILLESDKVLFFIDFQGWEIDSRITKVLIFYLATDYDINNNRNIVILNPPNDEYLRALNNELLELLRETRVFQTHPLPFLFYHKHKKEVSIFWFGVYNENDIKKLDYLLYEKDTYTLRKSDFEDPDRISQKFNWFDRQGNLSTIFPEESRIVKFHQQFKVKFENDLINSLLDPAISNTDKSKESHKDLFLCSGNYYTKSYLRLDIILSNALKNKILSNLLYKRLEQKFGNLENYKFISITSSSNKIIKSLVKQELIIENQTIFIENYHKHLNEHDLQEDFSKNGQYILICDVIATGYLTSRIKKELFDYYDSELSGVGVYVDTIDPNFNKLEDILSERLVALFSYPIEKMKASEIENPSEFDLYRVNPFTNQPITLEFDIHNSASILLNPERFIEFFDTDALQIKSVEFNNAVHPYFFNMYKCISKKGNVLVDELFKNVKEKDKEKIDVILYPQKSAIELLDFDYLKSHILKNQKILDFEIERFPTKSGWRFPHLSSFFHGVLKNKKILIVDDAACSGDSILQLLDELSFFEVKEIVFLIFLSRLPEQRLEFFANMSALNNSMNRQISIKFYFGCHWNISTYSIYDNPILNESQWLNKLNELINTPNSIRKISKAINAEIKTINYFRAKGDYKYFPKDKTNGEINKKKLFEVRNEIGKVAGFRFYKQDFIFFDKLFIKNRNFNDSSQNHLIELICSVLVYEPFLYDRIKRVLPDLAKLLETFIDKIVFKKEIELRADLYYDWNKKDILHLFFIIYSENTLVRKLKEENGFMQLVNYSVNTFKKSNPINYLFYKILKYFPLFKNEVGTKKLSSEFKSFFNSLIDRNEILNQDIEQLDKNSLSEFRRFYSFIGTLPTDDSFKSQIEKIRSLYTEHSQPKIHERRQSLNQKISKLVANFNDLRNLKDSKSEERESVIKSLKSVWWFVKLEFLDPIISFYRTFDDYFKPYPYFLMIKKLEKQNSSLLEIYTFLDDFIFHVNQKGLDEANYKRAIEYIGVIDTEFGLESDFRLLFERPKTNLLVLTSKLEDKLKTLKNTVVINHSNTLLMDLNLPEKYAEKLIVEELHRNLEKYSNPENEIKIFYEVYKEANPSYLKLTISNFARAEVSEFSSYEGLNNLKALSDSDLFDIKYKYQVNIANNEFVQVLTFSTND